MPATRPLTWKSFSVGNVCSFSTNPSLARGGVSFLQKDHPDSAARCLLSEPFSLAITVRTEVLLAGHLNGGYARSMRIA